jgi:hypothetical protein
MLPFPLNLRARRMWLRPAGAGPGELACSLVVAGQVRWLRARLSGDHVLFDELEPRTNPTKWKPAQPAAVSQAERALRAVTTAKRGKVAGGRHELSADPVRFDHHVSTGTTPCKSTVSD